MSCLKHWILTAAVLCGPLLAACDSSNPGAAPDATADAPSPMDDVSEPDGGGEAASLDGTLSDVSAPDVTIADDGGDASPVSDGGPASDGSPVSDASDGGESVASRLLVPGTSLVVEGVTSDDYVVYYDGSTQTYYAKPLNGGAATAIYTAPASLYAGYAFLVNKVAFVWAFDSSYVGTLATWVSGMPQAAVVSTGSLAYRYQTVWAASDSQHIAYLQSTSSDTSVSALYGANPDGAGVTLLLSNVDTIASFTGQYPGCFPRVVFRGDYAVVSYCAAGDAGLTPMLQAFSISKGWAPVVVVPNRLPSFQYNPLDEAAFTFPFAVDPSGLELAVASASSANGALQVFPTDGGPGTVVDPNGIGAASLSFAGSGASPWSILYNTDAGALKQAYAANPAPQTLVDAGVNYFNGLSADGKWMLVSSSRNSGGWFSDVSLVSTQTPGAPVLMASSAQYGGLPVTPRWYGRTATGFTTDSAYAMTQTNMKENASNQWMGYLRSISVAPPNTSKLLSTGYMVDYIALTGSKLLLVDNVQDSDGGSPATVDLDVADPASSSGAVKIATTGTGNAAPSHELTQIVYLQTLGAQPGIYAAPVP
jgi:hypothetical protein